MATTETFTVDGMSCNGCSSKLKKALEALNGVSEADVVLEGGKVTVHYDPATVQPAQFSEVVEDLGFDLVP
nr:cation transporter [uncultured Acetobacter sp.]